MSHSIINIKVNILYIEEVGNSGNRQYIGSYFEENFKARRKKKCIRTLGGIEEVGNETLGRQPESIDEVVGNISWGIRNDFPPEDEVEFPIVFLYSNLNVPHQQPRVEIAYKACYRYRKLKPKELKEIAKKLRENLKQYYIASFEHLEEVRKKEEAKRN